MPLSGAAVDVYLRTGWALEALASATTGADGIARVDLHELAGRSRNLLALGTLLVYASKGGHYTSLGAPRFVHWLVDHDLEPRAWDVQFRMHEGWVIRGRVFGSKGEPLRGVAVELTPSGKDGRPELPGPEHVGADAFTDPNGRFAVCLPADRRGPWLVRAFRRDTQMYLSRPMRFPDQQDVEMAGIELPSLPTVRGIARYPDGDAVSDLTLEFAHPLVDAHSYYWRPKFGPVRARTDRYGRFELALPQFHGFRDPDEWPFQVALPGVDATSTGFDPQADAFEITLPAHRLRVVLHDGEGAPMAGQAIVFQPDGEGAAPIKGQADDRGEASLFLSPGAQGDLLIRRVGNAMFRERVEVPASGNESRLDLRVPDRSASGTLLVRIRTAAGFPRYPANLTLITAEGHDLLTEKLESDDESIQVEPGSYRLFVSSTVQAPWKGVPSMFRSFEVPTPVLVRAGQKTIHEVQIRLDAGLALRMHVGVAHVAHIHDLAVSLDRLDGAPPSQLILQCGLGGIAMSHTEQMYATELMEPGTYRLECEAPGWRTVTRDIQLIAGELTRLELQMERED